MNTNKPRVEGPRVTKLPYMYMPELAQVLGYANVASFRQALQHGRVGVPTYKIGKRRVADREVVKNYFLQKRKEGLAELKEKDA